MKLYHTIILALFLIPPAAAKDWYISTQGSDINPGTLERPYQTMQPILDFLENEHVQEAVNIYFLKGTYYLDKTWTFQAVHASSNKYPVTLSPYRGQPVTLSGGIPLNLNWEATPNGLFQAKYPTDSPPIDELYINDTRYRMARYPNYDPEAKFLGGTAADAISPQRIATWSHPQGGYLHALHSAKWGSKHYRIEGVKPDRTLQLKGGWQENRGGGFDPYFRGGYHKKLLFVENIFEELDAPGEWYLDQEKNTLYVYPRPNDKLSQANIVGAHLHELIKLRGAVDRPVQNIHFKGLRFAHTSRVFMQPYERLLRGDWSIARLAAVHLQGTEECSIQDCLFENLGGNAVFLNHYTRRASIRGNHFTHLGESAVCVVGNVEAVRSPAISYSNTLPQDEIDLTPGPKGKNYPADCLIENNLIHHIGIVGKQTAGVFLSMSQDITVSHNTIFNCPRAAICINDGCWGGHIIEYNDAFQTVRETGDHGPFNSWGRDRFWKTSYNGGRAIEPFAKERALLDNIKTTHIRYNRFTHDHGHSWGIDLDDGSSNYHVYKNLCIGMGVKLREGYFRKVENNIIIDGFGGFHIWLPGCDDIIARNIFVSAKPYQFIRANPEYAKTIDYNLFYNQGAMPVITGVGDPPRRMTLREWREKGFDRHSILADPKFLSPRTGNYKVQDDSPAHKLGFENFPMNRFGVYKKEFTQQIAPIERRYLPQKSKLQPNPAREENRRMWNGATIKNLRGEAEKSAAGMGEETGVLLVNVPQQSQAAQWGLKEGDVLIGWNQEKIHSVSDLLRQDKQKTNQPIKITVFNATERIIQIRH